MTTSPQCPELQLPGYTLIQRIGSGGYGEVWRASAPGGLTKAVKIVFGRSDQAHAASELRALEKIKSVRHPFLLSLERFEVIDDRLLVVMELADGSLRDRFRDCRTAGQPGVERAELLRYLRDAADALDYLGQQHDLQHLDIKPENLLLVGGHVKIADFGLVKDLHAPQASIIGGMTPTYAAPELFQGRPSPHSDQYSLAIIYQEMLTGTVPFDGASAAELTLQHINELPSLDPLSESDRFVISQALAKDPEHRFGSCSEMIEALLRAPIESVDQAASSPQEFTPARGNTTHRRARPASASEPSSPSPTLLFDEGDSNWARETAPVLIDLPEIEPLKIVPGPQLDVAPQHLQPALVIGIGGSGRRVLQTLQATLNSEGQGAPRSKALAMLLIDSNPQSIGKAQSAYDDSEGGLPLTADEVVCCPLKKPQDYKDKSDRLLKWLSRRWLYNIPRSLRVSGIRPLGRLAFVDHARQILQRIRSSARQALDVAQQEGSTAPLRVYFVGSLSGGSASGMLNDLAYATRAVLEHTGIKGAELIAIATHSPHRESEMTELTRINSFAWLTELAHWSSGLHSYPGDETAGIPPAEIQVRPFDEVYVLNLGDRVDDRQFDQATRDIADYLFLDAMTPAGAWIHACRARNRSAGTPLKLRTFALSRSFEVSDQMVFEVASSLLKLWGNEADGGTSPAESSVAVGTSGIPDSVAQFAALARQMVDEHLEGNAIALLGNVIRKAGITPATLSRQNALPLMDSLIPLELPEGAPGTILGVSLEVIAKRREEELAVRSARWLAQLAGTASGRPAHVLCEIDNLSRLLATLGDELQAQADRAWQAAHASLAQPTPQVPVDQDIVDHWRKRLHLMGARLALHLCESQSKCLQLIAQDFDGLLETCRVSPSSHTPSADLPESDLVISRELLTFVDEQLRRVIARRGGYQAVFESMAWADVMEGMASLLPAVLRGIVSDGSSTRISTTSDLTHPRSAGPTLRLQGGECSQLQVGPDPTDDPAEALAGAARVTIPQLTRTYTLYEAGDLSPLHVAAAFVSGRRDYADMAERVHTRRDISWDSLLPGENTTDEDSVPSPFEGLVHDTQALEGHVALATAPVTTN